MKMHMAKKWPEKVVQRSFIKGHSFPIGLYVVTSESPKKKITTVYIIYSEYKE